MYLCYSEDFNVTSSDCLNSTHEAQDVRDQRNVLINSERSRAYVSKEFECISLEIKRDEKHTHARTHTFSFPDANQIHIKDRKDTN